MRLAPRLTNDSASHAEKARIEELQARCAGHGPQARTAAQEPRGPGATKHSRPGSNSRGPTRRRTPRRVRRRNRCAPSGPGVRDRAMAHRFILSAPNKPRHKEAPVWRSPTFPWKSDDEIRSTGNAEIAREYLSYFEQLRSAVGRQAPGQRGVEASPPPAYQRPRSREAPPLDSRLSSGPRGRPRAARQGPKNGMCTRGPGRRRGPAPTADAASLPSVRGVGWRVAPPALRVPLHNSPWRARIAGSEAVSANADGPSPSRVGGNEGCGTALWAWVGGVASVRRPRRDEGAGTTAGGCGNDGCAKVSNGLQRGRVAHDCRPAACPILPVALP